MQWIRTVGVVVILAGCASDGVEVSSSEQALDEIEVSQRVRCTPDGCLVSYARDRDGDGVSDVDELIAGTDPADPASFPTTLELLQFAGRGVLASFEMGDSMIVVLPTRDPRGVSLFGGREALPGRTNLMARLGVDRENMNGLDPSLGLSVFRHAGGGPRLGVRGIGFSQVGRESTAGLPPLVRLALDSSANRDWGVASITPGTSSATLHRYNGSSDNVSWWTRGNTTGAWVIANSRAGEQRSSRMVEQTKTTDGGTTTTTTTTAITNAHSSYASTEVETRRGGEVARETSWTRKETSSSGTTTETKGSSSTAPDGQTHTTVVTTTCNGEDCSTAVEESDPPVGTCGETVECEGVTTNDDPDYVAPVATIEALQHALVMLGSRVRTIDGYGGDVTVAVDPTKVDRWGPVSLLSDEAGLGQVVVFRGYNTAGPRYVQGVMQPEVGPAGSGPCTQCQ